MKRLSIAAAIFFLATHIQAATLEINFDDIARGTADPVTQGFSFGGAFSASQVVSANIHASSTYPYPDNNVVKGSVDYLGDYFFTGLSFSRTDGGSFDLLSFDMSVWGNVPSSVGITGYYVGGGSISYNNPSDIWYTEKEFTFGAGWTNLSRVSMGQTSYAWQGWNNIYLDNIVVNVSTVPIPAAVWLFASGLGLLGWLRRRNAVS